MDGKKLRDQRIGGVEQSRRPACQQRVLFGGVGQQFPIDGLAVAAKYLANLASENAGFHRAITGDRRS